MFSILVAEDDRNLNRMICAKLKQEQYNVFPAFDGQEALDIMEREHIDLVISDVMMPRMDGLELTSALRGAKMDLPILIITAKGQMEDMEKGFRAGTDDYMVKPIQLRELMLRVSFAIDLPPLQIESDPDMTKQVWLNLIDNAVKYSGEGSTIHISGQLAPNSICVSIRDEGMGIPAEKQAHIFERFYQCDESHQEKGHGLGLSIVKRILELLGGQIDCQSQLGKGTEMTVALPLDSGKSCVLAISSK